MVLLLLPIYANDGETMKINIEVNGKNIIFKLNNSDAIKNIV